MNMTVKVSPDGWRSCEINAYNVERILDDELVRFSFRRPLGEDFPMLGNSSRIMWSDVEGGTKNRYIVCEYRKIPGWQYYVIELLAVLSNGGKNDKALGKLLRLENLLS